MKMLFLLPILAAVSLVSCHTITPVDPMTMKPTCKCLPGHFNAKGPCDCNKVIAEK